MTKPLALADKVARAAVGAPSSPYLTFPEAMIYLRRSRSGLMKLIAEGLPVCHLGGRRMFDTRELDAYVRGTTALDLQRQRRRK